MRSVAAVNAVMREPLPPVLHVGGAASVATGRAAVVGTLRDNPALRNETQRWERLLIRAVGALIANTHDPAGAAALILRGYRPNTQHSYMSKCRAFFSYSAKHDCAPLPALVATTNGYILNEPRRGKLTPQALDKYLSAIATLHRLDGYADPTKDLVVRLAVFRFRSHALERAGCELALQRLPLPAAFSLRACLFGLSTPNAYRRLQCAGLVLSYVLLNRPGAAACMRRLDVDFTTDGMELQVVDFEMALRTGGDRPTFAVSTDWEPGKPDRVAQLMVVTEQHDAAGQHARAMLFADPYQAAPASGFWLVAHVTNMWLRRALELVSLRTPLGGKYQGLSLRSGVGSEAYAIGLPAAMIAAMMGHASVETTLRSYIKTRWRSSPAAWEVLGSYAPRLLRLKRRIFPPFMSPGYVLMVMFLVTSSRLSCDSGALVARAAAVSGGRPKLVVAVAPPLSVGSLGAEVAAPARAFSAGRSPALYPLWRPLRLARQRTCQLAAAAAAAAPAFASIRQLPSRLLGCCPSKYAPYGAAPAAVRRTRRHAAAAAGAVPCPAGACEGRALRRARAAAADYPRRWDSAADHRGWQRPFLLALPSRVPPITAASTRVLYLYRRFFP